MNNSHEYGFERDLYLFGVVDDASVLKIIERINIINRFDQEMIHSGPKNYQPQPIALYINSGGGSFYAGMSLYSAIKNSPTPVVTIGLGMVASAALQIFLGGKYRVIYSYTTLLFHSAKYGTLNATPHDVDRFNDHYQMIDKQMMDITRKECNIPEGIYEKVRKENLQFYMTPDEAYNYGICDSIYDLEAVEKQQEEELRIQKEIEEVAKNLIAVAMAEKEKEAKSVGGEPGLIKGTEEASKPEEKNTDLNKAAKTESTEKSDKKFLDGCNCDFCKRQREQAKK